MESHWKLSAEWHQRWEVIIMALFWLSVVLTVFSGLSYLIRHRRHLPGSGLVVVQIARSDPLGRLRRPARGVPRRACSGGPGGASRARQGLGA
jgi:hypothetical protein